MSRERSGSSRGVSNDRGFNFQNRSDRSRQYLDSNYGNSRQNNRYNPYDRESQTSDYGFTRRNIRQENIQSRLNNRDYEDSTETQNREYRCNEILNFGDKNYSKNPRPESGYYTGNPRHERQKYSSSPRHERENYSRSPRRETGNYSRNSRHERENYSSNPRHHTRNYSGSPRDETGNYSRNSRHESENFSNNPRHYTRNYSGNPRDETGNNLRNERENYPSNPRHDTRNYSGSPRDETGNYSRNSRHERENYSINPRHERENYSSSPRHDTRSLSSNPRYETGNYSGSARDDTGYYFNNPRHERENHSRSPRHEIGNIFYRRHEKNFHSSSPRHEAEYYSGSPKHETENYFGNPRDDTGNNFNNLRNERENYPDNPRHETEYYSGRPKHEMESYSGNPRYETENHFGSLLHETRNYSGDKMEHSSNPRHETKNYSRNPNHEAEFFSNNFKHEMRNMSDFPRQDNEHHFSDYNTENLTHDHRALHVEPMDTGADLGVEMSVDTESANCFEEDDKIGQNDIDDDKDDCAVLPGYFEGKRRKCHSKIMTNKFINQDSQILLIFLSHVCYNLFYSRGNREHCDLMAKFYLGHRNALKLYRYEVRQLLDRKYKKCTSVAGMKKKKRKDLLRSRIALLEMDSVLKVATKEQKARRIKLVDECIALLSANDYPEQLVPVAEDYVPNPNVIQTATELRQEYQWTFFSFTYRELGFKLAFKMRNIQKLLNFTLENELLPKLLVEIIRTSEFTVKTKKVKPGDHVKLTGVLKFNLKHFPAMSVLRSGGSRKIFDQQLSKNEVFKTNIMDLLPPGADLSNQRVSHFANSILYFDEAMTVVRSKLIAYTPFIPLSDEVKLEIFNNMVIDNYRQAFNIWMSSPALSDTELVSVSSEKHEAENVSENTSHEAENDSNGYNTRSKSSDHRIFYIETKDDTDPDEPLRKEDWGECFEEEDKISRNEIGDDDNACKILPDSIKVKHSNCHSKIMTNQFINEDNKIELIFLSHAVYNIKAKGGHRMHCDLMSTFYLGHRNALQLYRYEVRQLLDERYRQEHVSVAEIEERKRNNLRIARQTALLEMDLVFKDATEEQKARREKLVDECIDLISANVYPEKLVPAAEDYVQVPTVIRTETELKQEFQWKFFIFTYQELGFKIAMKQRNVEKVVKFHTENRIIPLLLVEIIRTSYKSHGNKVKPGDNVKLTGILNCNLKHAPMLNILRNTSSRMLFERQLAKSELFQTEIMDLLPADTNLSAQIVLNFANTILYFDQVMTVVRSKLINYTPFIHLSTEKKLQIFNDMVKSVYVQTLDVWKNSNNAQTN